MQFLLPILLLSTLTIPLHSSLHESHFTKQSLRRSRTASEPPENYLEVTKPLTLDSMNSSCTLPILTHNFSNTYGLPPVSAPYSAPDNCTWSNVVLELQVSCKGEQYDRIAAVWLSGAELLRTSTAEPTENGVFWKVRKDVTKYSSLLAQDNLTLSVMLENLVNDVFTGVYEVNITFHYYNVSPLIALPTDGNGVFESYEKPADLIVPISSGGENGFWFRIQNELEVHTKNIGIPTNTYRAVIEVFSSAHGDDEFWYSNPPDAYFKNMESSDSEMVKVKSNRGHGAYREILVKVDGDLIGTVVPFPVVFTGGINPLFWEAVVGIGAFDLPSCDLEITPFLNLVLDGKNHTFSFQVSNGISFWLVDANLHLWIDRGSTGVQAGMTKNQPEFSLEREYKFRGLDGKFEIETEREMKVSGWMNTSAGNLTTSYERKVEFENTIEFRENGMRKSVEQKVKEKTEIKIKSGGKVIFKQKTKRKYPLKLGTETFPGENGAYYMTTTLENSIEDEKTTGTGKFATVLKNRQESRGGMLVKDNEVLDGHANTQQRYSFRDQADCYARDVAAANGTLVNDVTNSLCEAPALCIDRPDFVSFVVVLCYFKKLVV